MFATGNRTPVAFSVSKGDILVAVTSPLAGWDNVIMKVNAATGVQTVIGADCTSCPFSTVTGAILMEDGNVLVADRGTSNSGDNRGKLVVLNAYDGSAVRVAIGDWYDPFSVTQDVNGRIYVADSGFDASTAKSNYPSYYEPGVWEVTPGAHAAHNTYDDTQWTKRKVSPVEGVTNYMSKPYNIITLPNGDIVVSDSDSNFDGDSDNSGGYGGIIKINPKTGVQTPLVKFTNSSASKCPFGIARDVFSEDPAFIVSTFIHFQYGCNTDYGLWRVTLGIDADHFNIDVVSAKYTSNGYGTVNWETPFGIVDNSNGKIVVIDEGYGNLYRLNQDGGFNNNGLNDGIAILIIGSDDDLHVNLGYDTCSPYSCQSARAPDVSQAKALPIDVTADITQTGASASSDYNGFTDSVNNIVYAGKQTIHVTWRNDGDDIDFPFYAKINVLSNAHDDDYLISADNGRGRVGDIQSLGDSWAHNESKTFDFVVGFGHQEQYVIDVKVFKREP